MADSNNDTDVMILDIILKLADKLSDSKKILQTNIKTSKKATNAPDAAEEAGRRRPAAIRPKPPR
jgi:hypothetical protein